MAVHSRSLVEHRWRKYASDTRSLIILRDSNWDFWGPVESKLHIFPRDTEYFHICYYYYASCKHNNALPGISLATPAHHVHIYYACAMDRKSIIREWKTLEPTTSSSWVYVVPIPRSSCTCAHTSVLHISLPRQALYARFNICNNMGKTNSTYAACVLCTASKLYSSSSWSLLYQYTTHIETHLRKTRTENRIWSQIYMKSIFCKAWKMT